MAHIKIEFTLFSAFYSPLISLMSGGFLQAEGLEADWTVSPPGVSAVKALEEGRADVIQSAPSQAFTSLAKGETPTAIHFAQINEMDGSSLPVWLPIRTLIGSGSKGPRSSYSVAASPWQCSNMPATRQALILPSSKSSALVVPRKWIRRFGKAKGSTFSSKGLSRSSSKPIALATSLHAAARRSDLSLFRAWRRRGIGCNLMSPTPSCATTRRHGPTWWRRRQSRSPKRKNHSSPQSSLMFWRSVSQAINNSAAGLHMWRSHGQLSRSRLTSSSISVRSRSDMHTIRFARLRHPKDERAPNRFWC
jgi:hypothetical protein